MFRFLARQHGNDRVGVAAAFNRLANEMGIPAHLTPDQASGFALDYLRRCIEQELATLEVECERG